MLRGVWERCFGCHIVMRKKPVNWQVVQLEEHPGIEEKLCRFQSELKKMAICLFFDLWNISEHYSTHFSRSLWDISVEEDVSAFYLEFGALDIFVELFSNPNHR